jgi:AcrR family transcriptional regulator
MTRGTPSKAQQTKERILSVSLALFNQYGETQITTNAIADELDISPGNLYYHVRSKDDIIAQLFAQFEHEMRELLDVPDNAAVDIEQAWLFLHLLFELIWKYRFIYSDIHQLLANNRQLELHFKSLLDREIQVAQLLCKALANNGQLLADAKEWPALAENMVVLSTYWLSYEYVRNPRHLGEPNRLSAALGRGVYHVMHVLTPYLSGDARSLFSRLAAAYF